MRTGTGRPSSVSECSVHNRQNRVERVPGPILLRPVQPGAKDVPALAGNRNQSRVAAVPDMAAVPAAGLVAIRQQRHIVHIDRQNTRRPAAPLPYPAKAIRQNPLLQHIQVILSAQLICEARTCWLLRQAIASIAVDRASL